MSTPEDGPVDYRAAPVDGHHATRADVVDEHDQVDDVAGLGWKRAGLVLALVALLAAAGGVWWFTRATVAASSGATSPRAATTAWMYALRDDDDQAARRYVDRDAVDQVDAVRADFRARLVGLDMPAWIEQGSAPEGTGPDPAGTVAEWWKLRYQPPGTSGGVSYASRSLAWRFTLVEDNGWWITNVTPPPWCGPDGYVRCDA